MFNRQFLLLVNKDIIVMLNIFIFNERIKSLYKALLHWKKIHTLVARVPKILI